MPESYLNLGGTIRATLATETLEKITPHLKPLGITRVANVTGLDTINIPTAVAIRPNSKHLSVSQGKGLTLNLAKISAIMESIEGYHAENPKPPELLGKFTELATDYKLISPELFGSSFFPAAELITQALPWIQATELITKSECYIPHALICLDSTKPHSEYAYLQVSSNGLASGNTVTEATCHALYEVIERDALARWLDLDSEQQNSTQIDLTTIDSKLNRTLLDHFAAAQVTVQVWDITTNLGVPAYRCAIANSDLLRNLGIFYGSGAHLCKEIALARALTEAAQTRLTLISGSRDDVFPVYYEQPRHFQLEKSAGTVNYATTLQPQLSHSFATNLQELLRRLQQHNYHKVIVVDHTKPKLNIPVVHAFVPGLQFIGARHG